MKSKNSQSLKFELIFDLSLLTFCALILSEGLLIVLLRYELPRDLGDLAKSYLRPLHESFIHSKPYQERGQLGGSDEERQLQQAFAQQLSRWDLGERWAQVSVDFGGDPQSLIDADGPPKNASLRALRRPFLFVIPTIYEYQYFAEAPDKRLLRYRWSIIPFQESLTQFKTRAFLITLFIESLLVVLGYFFLFRKNILVPIDNLSRVSKAFLQENWAARSVIERHDELGSVAEALNEMAANIQEKEKKLVLTIESLKRANEEIEARQNEQLQIEKLASIGRLAAGVAHEVGNPLGAISGYIDILRRALKKQASALNPEDIELCDRIENETNRISRIIRALLQQARPPRDRIKNVGVKPVVVRSVQLAQIPANIDVTYEFEQEDAEVSAEEDQLVQVFLNILVNARHAIEMKKDRAESGRLKIRCNLRKLPFYRADATEYDTSVVRSLKPETYWVVSIEDNGIGISDPDQKKLFEPFFSTKAPGKGTGLGLYVSKSIVESFRGAIVVRSALNFGTSFSIFLPKAKSNILM